MTKEHPKRNTSPLVDHLLVALKKRIQEGVYQGGERLPAERALAEEFAVSRMVVRSAIDALDDIGLIDRSPGCRPIVRAVVGTDGRFNGVARRNFALWLTHRPTEAEVPALIGGIQKRLDHDAYRLIVENAAGETPEEVVRSEARFLVRLTRDRDIAGLILWYVGGESNLPALMMVLQAGIPVVFLDRLPPGGIEADHVGVDNAFSAEQAVRHLTELGHRRIAHITNLDAASTVSERIAGYRAALDAAAIDFDDQLVFCASGRYADLAPTCRSIVEAALRLPDPPTAVFCVNDRVAFNVMEAVKQIGLTVPDDLAVAGFDGVERWLPGPSFLTTCRQPFERMGAAAVDLLLSRPAGGNSRACRHVLLEAPLFIGGSTLAAGRAPKSMSALVSMGDLQ